MSSRDRYAPPHTDVADLASPDTLLVALTVFGIAVGMLVIAEDWTRAPLVAWLGIANSALSAVAVALLLARPAARWFKGIATNR